MKLSDRLAQSSPPGTGGGGAAKAATRSTSTTSGSGGRSTRTPSSRKPANGSKRGTKDAPRDTRRRVHELVEAWADRTGSISAIRIWGLILSGRGA